MEIHWTGFPQLRTAARIRSEARLHKLAAGHHDLIDVRIVADLASPHARGGQHVKIACQLRGQQLMARAAHEDLGHALSDGIDGLEQEIHRRRERTRTLRRRPRTASPEQILGTLDLRADLDRTAVQRQPAAACAS
jgi:ribosome-associated translation inhibitor RaiA